MAAENIAGILACESIRYISILAPDRPRPAKTIRFTMRDVNLVMQNSLTACRGPHSFGVFNEESRQGHADQLGRLVPDLPAISAGDR
jgi:hypothetical protein